MREVAGPRGLTRRGLMVVVVLGWPGAVACQRPVTRDSQPVSLTTTDRIDLVNSVLSQRGKLMAGRSLIEACGLATALQFTGDVRNVLEEKLHASIRGRQTENCRDFDVPGEPGLVGLKFDTIRVERGEFVMGATGGKRPSDLVVVPLNVFSPGGRNHREEWVMTRVRPGLWDVLTVRVFAFWWH